MGRSIDVTDSVLAVIDTQPGFLRKLEGPTAERVEDRVRWLVRVAIELGVPVVVTEEEPERNGATSPPILAMLPEGHARHRKEWFDLAANPEIVTAMEHGGRRTAVLSGLETDVCVAQSALGLLDAGWRVIVIADAVAAPGEAHEQGLGRMRDAGAVLVGTKGIAYEWLRTVERAWKLDAAIGEDAPIDVIL